MMKNRGGKFWAFLLMAALCVSFVGCGSTGSAAKGEHETQNEAAAPETTDAEDEADNKVQASDDAWGSLAFYGETVTVPCTLADLEAMDIHLYSEDEKSEMLSTPNGQFFMLYLVHGDEDVPLTAYFETGDDVSKKEENIVLTAVNSGLARKEHLTYKGFGYGDSIDDFVAAFGDAFDCVFALGGDDIHSGSVRLVGGDSDVAVRIHFVDGEWHTVELSYE